MAGEGQGPGPSVPPKKRKGLQRLLKGKGGLPGLHRASVDPIRRAALLNESQRNLNVPAAVRGGGATAPACHVTAAPGVLYALCDINSDTQRPGSVAICAAVGSFRDAHLSCNMRYRGSMLCRLLHCQDDGVRQSGAALRQRKGLLHYHEVVMLQTAVPSAWRWQVSVGGPLISDMQKNAA